MDMIGEIPNSNQAKSIAIMQPYFFPYLGYFQLIKAVDVFVIYDDVNYINKGYINRNSILLSGQSHKITLALLGASQNKLINEIKISNNAKKILKKIEMAYKKAPQFNEIFSMLKNILLHEETNLSKFIGYSLQVISNYLELNTKLLFSSEQEKDNALRAQAKILDICKRMEISTYINAIGGRELYDKATFKKQNLDLYFIKTRPQQYKQFSNEFVPNLSIIDVLMFNQKELVIKMLDQYELIRE